MPVAHITVHSEAAVTKIVDFCNLFSDVEYYVAPKPESSERNPAERVVVTADPIKMGLLMKHVVVNGLKTEWGVE